MRHLLSFALVLALVGCSGLRSQSEGDIEAIAHDEALDATAGKFSEIESRLEESESERERLQQRVNDLEQKVERLDNNDRVDTDNINRIMDYLNNRP